MRDTTATNVLLITGVLTMGMIIGSIIGGAQERIRIVSDCQTMSQFRTGDISFECKERGK